MDGAVIGLAFGIAFGRIGDLIIGDHLGKPTSWLLAFQYEGGNRSGFACAEGSRRATLEGGQVRRSPTRWPGSPHRRADSSRRASGSTDGVVRHVLRDVPVPGAVRPVEGAPAPGGAHARVRRGLRGDTSPRGLPRVDKRVFGLTGSQWTGLTVSIVCIVTLIVGRRRAPATLDDPTTTGEAGAADRTVPRRRVSVGVAVMVARRHGIAGSGHERERLAHLRSVVCASRRRAPERLARG